MRATKQFILVLSIVAILAMLLPAVMVSAAAGNWTESLVIDSGLNFNSYVGYGQNIQGNATFDPANQPVTAINAANVTVYAWDVDYPSTGDEIDQVYLNGLFLGNLTGSTSTWSNTTFVLDPTQIETIFGGAVYPLTLTVDILVDTYTQGAWLVEVDKVYIDIEYESAMPVPVDIKPQSCRNPLNVKDKGVLPVAILGNATFDISQVDPASVKLEGVSPLRWAMEDVATPYSPYMGKLDAFDCTEAGPDGFMDLTLKFNVQEIVATLGNVNDGDVLVLTLTGRLLEAYGGTAIIGEDVVVILKKGKP